MNEAVHKVPVVGVAEAGVWKPDQLPWLPIETAPKDGTEILVAYGWRRPDWNDVWVQDIAFWQDHKSRWVNRAWFAFENPEVHPVYWMPLQAPPKTAPPPPRV